MACLPQRHSTVHLLNAHGAFAIQRLPKLMKWQQRPDSFAQIVGKILLSPLFMQVVHGKWLFGDVEFK
jgi:hypothetical protein